MDETNGITAEIHFNPNYDNSYTSMGTTAALSVAKGAGGMLKSGLGKLWGGSKKDKEEVKEEKKIRDTRTDEIAIVVKKTEDGTAISQGGGSWLSHV